MCLLSSVSSSPSVLKIAAGCFYVFTLILHQWNYMKRAFTFSMVFWFSIFLSDDDTIFELSVWLPTVCFISEIKHYFMLTTTLKCWTISNKVAFPSHLWFSYANNFHQTERHWNENSTVFSFWKLLCSPLHTSFSNRNIKHKLCFTFKCMRNTPPATSTTTTNHNTALYQIAFQCIEQ